MKTPHQKLADHLEIDGWDIRNIHSDDLEWWADEIWELRSTWSPEGVSAFITFLVEPMSKNNRTKGQDIWGVGCSRMYPQDKLQAESGGTCSIKSGAKNKLNDFSLEMEKIRSCAINDIGL